MSFRKSNRRDFLATAAGIAAGAATPYFWRSSYAKAESENDKLNVAAIGTGGRGSGIGHDAGKRGNMVACCDVDRQHAERFVEKANKDYGAKPQIYHDYRKLLERKDIDIVTIGTPDHWHTAIAIAAMQAGKDVYCEKPLTLTIEEGKMICKVVDQTKRVFQVGTQQRSSTRFLQAIAIARSGRLGKPLKATCYIGASPTGGPFENTDPPPQLDWDFWLGQTPKVPYCPQRCHGSFRWWLEYSGGKMTDWGAHHVDIAQWGLGYEHSGPIEIKGEGEFPQGRQATLEMITGKKQPREIPNGFNTAVTFVCELRFADESRMIVRDGRAEKLNGILFEGENGRIFVNRGKITGQPIEELSESDKQWLADECTKLYKGKENRNHMGNFFECVKDRSEPVSDVFTHHRELSSCHMCNIALLLGRTLRWHPVKEDFIGDEQASAMVSRKQRKPYTIEA